MAPKLLWLLEKTSFRILHAALWSLQAQELEVMKKKKRNETKKKRPGRLPLQLSACMMVKDEEEMLPRCLASIKDHVDEIVVVDTGSTDRTVEIAESFGARIWHHPWQNDFSLHRNQSISYARGRWIFIIDADEEFVPPDNRILRDELALAEKDGWDALVMRVENSHSEGTGTICADSIRVFRNSQSIRYEGIVHNNLTGVTHGGTSMGRIVHYGYDRGTETARKKFERTATLLKKQITENPDNAAAHMYLSCSHASLNQQEDALREAVTAIDLVEAQGLNSIIFLRAYYTAARSLIPLGRFDEALDFCRKGEARFGEQVDLLAAQTMVHFERKEWEGVLRFGIRYREALEKYRKRRGESSLVDVNTFGDEWKICGWIGAAYHKLGDFERAETLFEESQNKSPNLEAACRQIGLFLVSSGDIHRSRPYLEEALRLSTAKKDSRVVEALLKIAYMTGDNALKEQSLTDALSLWENSSAWSSWLSNLADYAIEQRDSRSAIMLLAGIVAADENHLQAHLKLSHVLVWHEMIEAAVTYCDGLLRILGLPRNRTLSSISDLEELFRLIGVTLINTGLPGEAAIANAAADKLSTSPPEKPSLSFH